MAKREKVDSFLNKIGNFDRLILGEVLRGWNQVTENVLSDAQQRVPIASGHLRDTGATLQAKQTSTGIQSSVIYKANYAKKLHDDPDINFKNAGVFSYNDGGQKWIKAQKGEHKWLEKSKKEHEENLFNELDKAITRAWNII